MRGSCGCGSVTYELLRRPMFTHACHCKNCQTQTGGPFALNAILETESLKLIQINDIQTRVFSFKLKHCEIVLRGAKCSLVGAVKQRSVEEESWCKSCSSSSSARYLRYQISPISDISDNKYLRYQISYLRYVFFISICLTGLLRAHSTLIKEVSEHTQKILCEHWENTKKTPGENSGNI